MKLSLHDSNEQVMTRKIENLFNKFPKPYIRDVDIDLLFNGTPNSRYSKVKRMIAYGKLIHIKRGLYCLADKMDYLNLFELAQYIYGPSFISLESALQFHNLIPETVYTTTSVIGKRAKEFETPLGLFSYLTVPRENLYTEV